SGGAPPTPIAKGEPRERRPHRRGLPQPQVPGRRGSGATRELSERAWMAGFVQADFARTRDLELRDPAPALVLDRRYELDALALEFLDGLLDVVAHQEQDVLPRRAA